MTDRSQEYLDPVLELDQNQERLDYEDSANVLTGMLLVGASAVAVAAAGVALATGRLMGRFKK